MTDNSVKAIKNLISCGCSWCHSIKIPAIIDLSSSGLRKKQKKNSIKITKTKAHKNCNKHAGNQSRKQGVQQTALNDTRD